FAWWLFLDTAVRELRYGSRYAEYTDLDQKWFGKPAPPQRFYIGGGKLRPCPARSPLRGREHVFRPLSVRLPRRRARHPRADVGRHRDRHRLGPGGGGRATVPRPRPER